MILTRLEEEMCHSHHVCHLGSVCVRVCKCVCVGGGLVIMCVPTWQLRVIKKGREGAIQRFLVVNEKQH